MAVFEIKGPDGATYEINAPDDATEDQVLAYAQQNYSPKTEQGNGYLQTAKDFGKGAISGAADIGNTLINAASFVPRQFEKASNAIYGKGTPLSDFNTNREAGVKGFAEQNQGSLPFTLGRVGANIAGTAGAGAAAGTILKGLSQTPRALQLAEALRTGGFAKDVGTATNMLGGAGAASLGSMLIDPSTAPVSAGVGAALPVAGRLAGALGNSTADVVGGLGTHTGGDSVKQAVKSGFAGGESAKSFAQNMRGQVPFDDVINTVKQNLSNMAAQRGQQYRSGMVDIANDKTVLDFGGIDNAINNAFGKVAFKGQVKNQRGADVLQAIRAEVDNWKSLDPEQFHTPEGMDALKQKIGGILESIPFEERTANAVGKEIYGAVKSEINKQAPTYASVMKDYSEASDLIHEIQKSLVGGNKATVDASMRKLQSLMRNNANTNYGNRMQLAQALEQQGGNEIMPALAGQAMSSATPRGLGGAVASLTGIGGAATMNPMAIPALAIQSPRLVGEASLKAGQLARALRGPAALAPLGTAGIVANQ